MVRNRKAIQEEYAKACAQLTDEILKHSQTAANIAEAQTQVGKYESEIDRLKRLQLKLSNEYSKTPPDAEAVKEANEQAQPSN